jgi:hypothetical protein
MSCSNLYFLHFGGLGMQVQVDVSTGEVAPLYLNRGDDVSVERFETGSAQEDALRAGNPGESIRDGESEEDWCDRGAVETVLFHLHKDQTPSVTGRYDGMVAGLTGAHKGDSPDRIETRAESFTGFAIAGVTCRTLVVRKSVRTVSHSSTGEIERVTHESDGRKRNRGRKSHEYA